MTKLTLTKVTRFTTDKSGNPLVSKQGKPYTSVRIQSNEFGERWLSGFGNADNHNWKEGDHVEVIVKENGQYLNFDMPKKEDKQFDKINALETLLRKMDFKIDSIIRAQRAQIEGTKPEPDYPEPTGEPNFENVTEEYKPNF